MYLGWGCFLNSWGEASTFDSMQDIYKTIYKHYNYTTF